MNEGMNIYQRINAVMKEVTYVKRGSAGQGTGVKYDEAIAVLRPAMNRHGVVMIQQQVGSTQFMGDVGKQRLYSSDYEIKLVNMDDPKDYISYPVTAHAMDNGDKAPGKTSTYACKVVLLKAFALETGENDESRAEQADIDTINNDQQMELYRLLCDEQGNYNQKGLKLQTAFKFVNLADIKARKYESILKLAKK